MKNYYFITVVFMLMFSYEHVLGQNRLDHLERFDWSSQDGFASYTDEVVNWFEGFDGGGSTRIDLSDYSSVVAAALSDCVATNFGTDQPLLRQKLLCLVAPTYKWNFPLMVVMNHLATKRDTEKLLEVFRYTDFLFTVAGEKHQQFTEASSNYGKHYISTLDGGAYHESKVPVEHRWQIKSPGFTDENITFIKEMRAAYDQGRWDDFVSLTEQEISRIRESIK